MAWLAQLFSSFNHLHPSLRGRRWKGKGEFGRARERVGRTREKGKEPSSVVSSPNSLPLSFRTPATQANCIHAICSNIDNRQETERGCVTAVQFILFNFANYSPSIVIPGIVNRTQSNSIELNPWIEFDWVRQSNEIEHHTFSEFDFRTNRTQSNSIRLIVFDWVRKPNSIEHN